MDAPPVTIQGEELCYKYFEKPKKDEKKKKLPTPGYNTDKNTNQGTMPPFTFAVEKSQENQPPGPWPLANV